MPIIKYAIMDKEEEGIFIKIVKNTRDFSRGMNRQGLIESIFA